MRNGRPENPSVLGAVAALWCGNGAGSGHKVWEHASCKQQASGSNTGGLGTYRGAGTGASDRKLPVSATRLPSAQHRICSHLNNTSPRRKLPVRSAPRARLHRGRPGALPGILPPDTTTSIITASQVADSADCLGDRHLSIWVNFVSGIFRVSSGHAHPASYLARIPEGSSAADDSHKTGRFPAGDVTRIERGFHVMSRCFGCLNRRGARIRRWGPFNADRAAR